MLIDEELHAGDQRFRQQPGSLSYVALQSRLPRAASGSLPTSQYVGEPDAVVSRAPPDSRRSHGIPVRWLRMLQDALTDDQARRGGLSCANRASAACLASSALRRRSLRGSAQLGRLGWEQRDVRKTLRLLLLGRTFSKQWVVRADAL